MVAYTEIAWTQGNSDGFLQTRRVLLPYPAGRGRYRGALRGPMKILITWHLRTCIALMSLLLSACATPTLPRIETAAHVDLPRFMGDWYVIGHIPTFLEAQAFNAIERYDLNTDGSIATTFSFYKGSATGPFKQYHPTGFVRDEVDHSTWGMQFVWPIKAEYLIAYLDSAYTETIIARNVRDYVWIMARNPRLSEADYQRLVSRVAALGYDTTRLRRVPQDWPAKP
jgi:apolipoprotein D and lipocalin family protein